MFCVFVNTKISPKINVVNTQNMVFLNKEPRPKPGHPSNSFRNKKK
jgi:hypothetical protein